MNWLIILLLINFSSFSRSILAYFNVFSEKDFEGDHTLYFATLECKTDISKLYYNVSSIWSNTPESCMAFYNTDDCMDDQHVLLVISGLLSYLKDPPKTCEDLFCVVGSCEDLGDEVFSSFNKTILSYQLCPDDYLKRIKNGTWVSNESKTCILLDVDNLIT